MGRVKELLDLPYSLVDGNACIRCFGDRGIQRFIRKNADQMGCDFCDDARRATRRSCELNTVLEFMMERIGQEWEDPAEHIPYESAEGGYLEGFTVDTDDLLDWHVEVGFQNDAIREAVLGAISLWKWAHVSPFSSTPDEELYYGWEGFCRLIKEEARFVFFKHRSKSPESSGAQVSRILDLIGKYSRRLRLVRTLKTGTRLIRARRFNSRPHFTLNVRELGPPPPEVCARYPNRMSPAGIPMFYGALDVDTALAEIATHRDGSAAIGEFETLRPLRVVDLTKVPGPPSIFEEEREHLRAVLLFFAKFLWDFSKPVHKAGAEHVEYVPTQVVTEYFRHIFRAGKQPVDGVLYPSSRCKGTSCVLFIKNENCVEGRNGLDHAKHVLILDRSSCRKVRVPRRKSEI